MAGTFRFLATVKNNNAGGGGNGREQLPSHAACIWRSRAMIKSSNSHVDCSSVAAPVVHRHLRCSLSLIGPIFCYIKRVLVPAHPHRSETVPFENAMGVNGIISKGRTLLWSTARCLRPGQPGLKSGFEGSKRLSWTSVVRAHASCYTLASTLLHRPTCSLCMTSWAPAYV